ncbi:MAG TPA: 2-phospho-L-lactate transferase CofD family protein, partial [Dehalococcoidia bacterium]
MAGHVLALAGGVGGAKLALGLARLLPPSALTIVVNTGDDDEFHGLHVSPDLDTVTYTLAGLANPETGWGR